MSSTDCVASPAALDRPATILVLTLGESGERRELADGGTLSVGRAQENDWILSDRTVGRRHCCFALGPAGATVTDLGSTNGTRVDGHTLPPHMPTTLLGGEAIEIGVHCLTAALFDPWMATPVPAGPPLAPFRTEELLRRVPSLVEEDPLAGGFGEALRPLPRGAGVPPIPAWPEPGKDAPQHEALLPHRAAPWPPRETPTAVPAAAPASSALAGDPFGQGSVPAALGAAEAGAAASTSAAPGAADPASGEHWPSAQQSALLAAFLAGAGQPPSFAQARDPEAFLHEAGRVFACLADGLRELLAVRAAIKDQAGLDRTLIGASFNNPLKLSVNRREAAAALLGARAEGYLAPLAAVEAGFRDLKAHELAVLDGIRLAVEEFGRLIAPATLAREHGEAGMLARMAGGGRSALLWHRYQECHAEIARSMRMRFLGTSGDAFRAAYARKTAELSLLNGLPPGDPPPGRPQP